MDKITSQSETEGHPGGGDLQVVKVIYLRGLFCWWAEIPAAENPSHLHTSKDILLWDLFPSTEAV